MLLNKEQFLVTQDLSGRGGIGVFGIGCSLDPVLFVQVWKLGSLKLSLNFDSCVFRKGNRRRYSGFGRVFVLIVNCKF